MAVFGNAMRVMRLTRVMMMLGLVVVVLGRAEAVRQGNASLQPVAEPSVLRPVSRDLEKRARIEPKRSHVRPERRAADWIDASRSRLMLGFEPLAVIVSPMGASGRKFYATEERECRRAVVEDLVLGDQVEIADTGDAAEANDLVQGDAANMGVRAFAKIVAANVRKFRGNGQPIADAVGEL